ncbi:hypothetical protein CC78DRAFT_587331 [Lojkania enalia]|uniref:C2H2-type domain-containing protein n=1 Tax=Lojkania enalia TaxID=147567 RepID=A0A9P4MUV7_9PLEO|nr:hypothetical protein CC78DRAFT_587331 [Didymosphaeria enalia]
MPLPYDSETYWDYVEEENFYTECERHFDTPQNLTQHGKVHHSPDFEFLGCDRRFTAYGGMISHLEPGTCDSGLDGIDINEAAAICYQ